jgi:hypothetical protein
MFQTMLGHALRICEAQFGHLLLYDGRKFRAAALGNVPPVYAEIWDHGPISRQKPPRRIGGGGSE